MSAEDVITDEQWGQALHSYGQDQAPIADDDIGDVDVAALMSDDDVAAEPVAEGAAAGPDEKADGPGRFDHKILFGFGSVVAGGVVAALAGAIMFYSHDSQPGPPPVGSLSEPQAVAAAKPSPTAPASAGPGVDRSLPYTADAQGSCAEGSTPAQTMSGMDPHNAFVCVRGGGDGQVISIDLGRTYVITAISLTPGWTGLDASGVSQWSQHRVVTIVQYSFPDDPSIPIVTQNTQNVHGDAVQPIKRVLASRIRMLIRYTSRPPADPATTPRTPAPGVLPGLFGDPGTPPTSPPPLDGSARGSGDGSDPVDATFAISSLKIIGHEAV
ncbi:hypothetical protein [Mycobacterium avium]|uniref:hypothetical protein n=1 Tax=Mycobacterium avium TaxID=1764 RepID=UPI00079FEAD4|nr:hypothetical protein [Mycobacterium avium]